MKSTVNGKEVPQIHKKQKQSHTPPNTPFPPLSHAFIFQEDLHKWKKKKVSHFVWNTIKNPQEAPVLNCNDHFTTMPHPLQGLLLLYLGGIKWIEGVHFFSRFNRDDHAACEQIKVQSLNMGGQSGERAFKHPMSPHAYSGGKKAKKKKRQEIFLCTAASCDVHFFPFFFLIFEVLKFNLRLGRLGARIQLSSWQMTSMHS